MTCPNCHAQLLPMQSEYFCLQCGEVVPRTSQAPEESLKLEETADPLLQRAITDVVGGPVNFVTPPVSSEAKTQADQPPVNSLRVNDISAPVAPEILATSSKTAEKGSSTESVSPAGNPSEPLSANTSAPRKWPSAFSLTWFHRNRVAPAKAQKIPLVAQALHGSPHGAVKINSGRLPKRLQLRGLGYAAIGVVVALSVVNAGTAWYLHNRIYPGVRVAGLELGGVSIDQAASTVAKSNQLSSVTLTIGTTTYQLDARDLGVSVDAGGAITKAQMIGHSETVPLVGLLRSLRSGTVVPGLSIDQERLNAKLAQLASSVAHPATGATIVMNGVTPLIIAEKSGESVSVDQLKTVVIKAITTNQKVVINTTKIAPSITSSTYANTISQLQARLTTNIKISVRNKIIALSSQQIAPWLRWSDDGAKVWVDPASVTNYVLTIPGSYNRLKLASQIVDAINATKSVTITASGGKSVGLKSQAVVPVAPVRYSYCVASQNVTSEELALFVDRLASIYAKTDGWSLGGKLVFVPSAGGCNYTISLVAANDMASYSTACDSQSTCRVGNNLVINAERWRQPPASWKSTQASYQVELVNHETGHWLGFDHAACGSTAPPISQTVATVSGCSSAWWAIPPQLQSLKILPGF